MLDLRNLEVCLDTEAGVARAVDGVSLAIRRGQTFALVGESGCGKSLTALALMRLLPDNGAITAGQLWLDGEDVFAWPAARLRRLRGARVGMIFQEPATSLNPVLTVGRQIVEAIEAHTPLRGRAARERAIEWLHRVGIPDPRRRVHEFPFRLSGGQKQRVMIALALAGEPDFLLADEPTTALDVTVQAQILALLRELQRERGMGLLLITHDLAVVSGMADHVALMYAGQIVETAPAAEFFARPRHPYAQALLRAVPQPGGRGAPLAAIPGAVPSLGQSFRGCRFAARCEQAFGACEHTRPELVGLPGGAGVRCLLYSPARDGGAPVAAPAAPARAAAAPPGGAAPPSAGDALLELRGLSVRFPLRAGLLRRVRASFTAVERVSLRIDRGQTLALVGESGCGKTTLGKAVVQLLRGQAVVQGQALFEGRDLFTLRGTALREARRAVQIVFQDPFASLDPRMRVADLLEEGLQALCPHLDAAARRRRSTQMLEQVGLASTALGRFPHEFSGGQRQRIAIARALAVQPRLVVCDEPTSALDVSVQAQILNLLAALQRELGLSYLFISHNLGAVAHLADRIAVMHGGRLEEEGAAEEVLQRPRTPVTRRLLAAVPRLGTPIAGP